MPHTSRSIVRRVDGCSVARRRCGHGDAPVAAHDSGGVVAPTTVAAVPDGPLRALPPAHPVRRARTRPGPGRRRVATWTWCRQMRAAEDDDLRRGDACVARSDRPASSTTGRSQPSTTSSCGRSPSSARRSCSVSSGPRRSSTSLRAARPASRSPHRRSGGGVGAARTGCRRLGRRRRHHRRRRGGPMTSSMRWSAVVTPGWRPATCWRRRASARVYEGRLGAGPRRRPGVLRRPRRG